MSTSRTAAVLKNGRLDAALAAVDPSLSRSRWTKLVRQGHVKVDGVLEQRPACRVFAGQELTADIPEPTPAHAVAQDLPLTLVYQDADIAVVDKEPGRVVHPGAGNPDGTLVNALLHHLDDLSGIGGAIRPGIVHRLDKGTSGLLVVAKNDDAHRHLAAQFADHSAYREYVALCSGYPRQRAGRIETELGRHPTNRVKFASLERGGKRAVTHWSIEQSYDAVHRVVCRLETGRTHQIRVHLSEMGLPLLGDPLYGRAKVPSRLSSLVQAGRPLLHAYRLQLVHPRTQEPCVFEAAIPRDFQAVLDALTAE